MEAIQIPAIQSTINTTGKGNTSIRSRLRSPVLESTQTSDRRSNVTFKHFALLENITKHPVDWEWLGPWTAVAQERHALELACARALCICYHAFSTNVPKELNYSSFKVLALHLALKPQWEQEAHPAEVPGISLGLPKATQRPEAGELLIPSFLLALGNLIAALFEENL